ncbi:MAG: hypothetical protein NW220_09195 [Leptolyngbyaceae cyanobacterium bins.349]|nr:hypothetical protein [Leptolyngbyaceae cyanobacterium bins.349]
MKTAFLILGAQRSGTSVISHVLSTFGINFGNPQRFIQGEHNPIFFELDWVNDINNQIVQQSGHEYIDFFLPIELDFEGEKFAALEQKIQAFVLQEWGNCDAIALKDPRFSLTFSVWQRVLTALGYRLNIILAFRCPSGFLASNKKLFHNWAGWTDQRHLNFWLQFNLAAIYFTRHCSTYWMNYDHLMADPQAEVQALAEFFALDRAAIAAATSVIQPSQYHHQTIVPTGFPLIDNYYDRLRLHQLDATDYLHYREQFEQFQSAKSLQST